MMFVKKLDRFPCLRRKMIMTEATQSRFFGGRSDSRKIKNETKHAKCLTCSSDT